jgi:anti-anti-sigma regulatory factor
MRSSVRGAIFFGSSIQVLSNILYAAGIHASIQEKAEITRINSPLPHHSRMNSVRIPENLSPASVSPSLSPGTRGMNRRKDVQQLIIPYKPRFLVLDLSSVSTVDATSARGCFLQLAKMASARGIVVCAAGQNSRIDWIMQTHDCAGHLEAETISEEAKQKIILFDDLNDALLFCEKTLVTEKPSNLAFKRFEDLASPAGVLTSISLSTAFTHFIGVEPEHAKALDDYEKSARSFHIETRFKAGECIFSTGTNSDGFYIVLSGSVVVLKDEKADEKDILSGAGRQQSTSRRNIVESSNQVSSVLSVGRIFGFVDFVLQRPRSFSTVAGSDNTLVAKVSIGWLL